MSRSRPARSCVATGRNRSRRPLWSSRSRESSARAIAGVGFDVLCQVPDLVFEHVLVVAVAGELDLVQVLEASSGAGPDPCIGLARSAALSPLDQRV
jgi:hypothetical protein